MTPPSARLWHQPSFYHTHKTQSHTYLKSAQITPFAVIVHRRPAAHQTGLIRAVKHQLRRPAEDHCVQGALCRQERLSRQYRFEMYLWISCLGRMRSSNSRNSVRNRRGCASLKWTARSCCIKRMRGDLRLCRHIPAQSTRWFVCLSAYMFCIERDNLLTLKNEVCFDVLYWREKGRSGKGASITYSSHVYVYT